MLADKSGNGRKGLEVGTSLNISLSKTKEIELTVIKTDVISHLQIRQVF